MGDNEKEKYFFLTKLHNLVENYDKSLNYLEKSIEIDPHLSSNEQEIFISTFRNSINYYRDNILIIKNKINILNENEKNEIILLNNLKNEFYNKMENIIKKVDNFINKLLIPQTISPFDLSLYHLILGDFYRYLSETNNNYINKSENEYKNCLEICNINLPISHPNKLTSVLNLSILYSDIKYNLSESILFLENNYNECINNIDLITDIEQKKNSISICEKIKNILINSKI